MNLVMNYQMDLNLFTCYKLQIIMIFVQFIYIINIFLIKIRTYKSVFTIYIPLFVYNIWNVHKSISTIHNTSIYKSFNSYKYFLK